MIRLAVDGSGLARPWAGVGTYTREIVTAMALARPAALLEVHLPGGSEVVPAGSAPKRIPRLRLLGRHLLWRERLRHSGAAAYFGPAGQLPLSGVGLPSVVTAHDLAIYRHPEWFPERQWLSTRWLVPRSLRGAGAVVAVSANTAADVQELFEVDPGRLHVIPEGVGRRFRPLPAEALREAAGRYRLPARFLLFVGTIEPRKNLLTLIEAWSSLRRRPPLVLAGDWGWRAEAVRVAAERAGGDVRVLGAVSPDELPALYNLAAALVHPAWYEGFGLTPLEAMACGTPVAVANVSSLPEVVGGAALLVDPSDVEGWTRAMERLLEDAPLRESLRGRGLERAAALTWEVAALRTWAVLDLVMAGRGDAASPPPPPTLSAAR